jgi:NADP-dependent 3-hydroxy acid dehydrogenase YdfG
MSQDDPVLIITGASTGIGAATAHRAVEFGHRVVLAARSEEKLQTLAGELGGEEKAIAVRCDVSTASAALTATSPTPASAPSAAFSRSRWSTGSR